MTPGTGQSQPQNRPSHHINLIIHIVRNHLLFIDIPRHKIGDRQHAGCHESIGINLIRIRRLQQIASDLLPNKLVIGKVLVERIDDPVAITPRLTKIAFGRQLDQVPSIRITNNIQPMSPPTFTIPG